MEEVERRGFISSFSFSFSFSFFFLTIMRIAEGVEGRSGVTTVTINFLTVSVLLTFKLFYKY